MHNDISPMHEYFAKLGLEPGVADAYIALDTYGPQSLLQLARNANIERTRLYRLLDTLTESQLVEIDVEYKRKIYKAAPLSNLQILLTKKEQEVQQLHQDLSVLQAAHPGKSHHSPTTHVQFYRGVEGVKQMFWNETKAKSEALSILYENMQGRTNAAFFDRWVARCNETNRRFRSVVGDHFLESQRTWYERHDNQRLQHWEGKYIAPSIFPIKHSMVTYDDVVAYFNWKDGEIFGVEVHNAEIAATQRQFFEMLWQQAQPLPN